MQFFLNMEFGELTKTIALADELLITVKKKIKEKHKILAT